jgi:hypothetical protein
MHIRGNSSMQQQHRVSGLLRRSLSSAWICACYNELQCIVTKRNIACTLQRQPDLLLDRFHLGPIRLSMLSYVSGSFNVFVELVWHFWL